MRNIKKDKNKGKKLKRIKLASLKARRRKEWLECPEVELMKNIINFAIKRRGFFLVKWGMSEEEIRSFVKKYVEKTHITKENLITYHKILNIHMEELSEKYEYEFSEEYYKENKIPNDVFGLWWPLIKPLDRSVCRLKDGLRDFIIAPYHRSDRDTNSEFYFNMINKDLLTILDKVIFYLSEEFNKKGIVFYFNMITKDLFVALTDREKL